MDMSRWHHRGTAIVLGVCLIGTPNIAAQEGVPSAAVQISVGEGEGAVFETGRIISGRLPFVVVRDQTGAPAIGARVVFVGPEIGPGIHFPDNTTGTTATVTTGSDGVAMLPKFRTNDVPGSYQIRVVASYQGDVARAFFRVTNVPTVTRVRAARSKRPLIVALVGAVAGAAAWYFNQRASQSGRTGDVTITSGSTTIGAPR